MAQAPVFEWEAKPYDDDEKNADWFWALGIIAIAGIVACVLFNNVLLALVVATGAIAIGLEGARRPRMHRFAIMDTGIFIDENFYPYDNMMSFSVLEHIDPAVPPILSITNRNFFSPHLVIPIVAHEPEQIYFYIVQHVEEGKHDPSPIDRLVEMIRF